MEKINNIKVNIQTLHLVTKPIKIKVIWGILTRRTAQGEYPFLPSTSRRQHPQRADGNVHITLTDLHCKNIDHKYLHAINYT